MVMKMYFVAKKNTMSTTHLTIIVIALQAKQSRFYYIAIMQSQ